MKSDSPSLIRTSSVTSVLSDDPALNVEVGAHTSRRTRKRFASNQLVLLEHLFHQNSHPTREEREAVAREGGMEIKSVTIWFQNKRQTERKTALHTTTNRDHTNHVPVSSSPARSGVTTRSSSSSSSRLSLDRVASRSELRIPAPQTPSRPHNPNAPLWDKMPSSPLGPPLSPPQREYVEFGKLKRTRTLEWACAAARLADKEGGRDTLSDLGDDTDEDTDEAITPSSSYGRDDGQWTMGNEPANPQKGAEDDDMMRAALVLCGLGRRSE